MRLEAMGLRTLWLATFAGWALLVCAMAAFGLAGRVRQLQDDGAARPLPALPAAAAERLGDFAQYAAIAERPVFAEDRRPRPFLLGGSAQEGASGLRLTGVLITPGFQMATLTTDQGKSVRLRLPGESVEGWQLLSLSPRSATVSGPGGTQTLELQVFNGQGGTPPTVLRGVPGANGQPVRPPASTGGVGTAAPPPVAVPAPAAVPPTPPPAPAADDGSEVGAEPAPEPAGPSAEQLNQIRERIEARRRALQQQARPPGGAPSPGQNR